MWPPEAKNRITYAVICYEAEHSGVYKKIKDQIDAWRKKNYNVRLVVITDSGSISLWQALDSEAMILVDQDILSKIKNRFKFLNLAIATSPELLYIRDSFPLLIPKSNIPVVVEFQTLVGQELRSRSFLKFFLFELFKKPLYAPISGAVYVSKELEKSNEIRSSKEINRLVVGNGINLERIEQLKPSTSPRLGLIFVGAPGQPWHGLNDLVEFGIQNPDIDIHIVGSSQKSANPNIIFHGFLSHPEYRLIAEKCHAGVGSLSLGLNKMKEASPLKVRDYLALGLPVIIRYEDTDLNESDDFVLRLPMDDMDLKRYSSQIRAFLKEWSTKRVPREAIARLDVSIKEEIRLRFFDSLIH